MLSKNYSNFWQKVIDMVLNSVSYAYRRVIQKNMVQLTDVIVSCLFRMLNEIKSSFFPKSVSRVFKQDFCVSRATIWGKPYFLKKKFSPNFRILLENSIDSGKNFSAKLSKLHYRRPEQNFDLVFFWKKIKFCSTITKVERKILNFSKQNFGKHFRTAFWCSEVLQFDESVFLMKDFFR